VSGLSGTWHFSHPLTREGAILSRNAATFVVVLRYGSQWPDACVTRATDEAGMLAASAAYAAQVAARGFVAIGGAQ